MFEIKIINELNNLKFSGEFESQEICQEWIDRQILKNSWGKPERTLSFPNETDFAEQYPQLVDRVKEHTTTNIMKSVPVLDGEGNPTYTQGEQLVDEEGNLVVDENGNPVYGQYPVMEEVLDYVQYNYLIKADYVITIDDITAQVEEEGKLELKRKKIRAGSEMIAYLGHLNEDVYNFTGQEIAQILSTFSAVFSLLVAGGIETAYGLIQSLEVSEPINENYKTLALAKLGGLIASI